MCRSSGGCRAARRGGLEFALGDNQRRTFHELPSGMRMEVIAEAGRRSTRVGCPIVMVHGSFHAAWCSAIHWLPYFASRGHDCFALSLLGQGESDVPSQPGTLQSHAKDISHFIRHKVEEPPILVGHSFGGLIVQEYLSCLSKSNPQESPTSKGEGHNKVLDNLATCQHLTSERVETKAFVMQFLKRFGLSTVIVSRIVNKADMFITHLVSMLHFKYQNRYLAGSEISTIENQSSLLPYLEALAANHGDNLVDFILHFPNPPPVRKHHAHLALLDSSQKKGILEAHVVNLDRKSNAAVSYMLAVGLTHADICTLTKKFPYIASYNPEKKMKPVVELLLAFGVPRSGIRKIFLKRPQIFGCSVEENLKPAMAYLESLGVERSSWARILTQFPALPTYSKKKIQHAVGFLHELGLSPMAASKILNRFPHLIGFSVEEKMKPTAQYLKCIGIKDTAAFISSSPQVLGYSIEGNIKPACRFFRERGFTRQEITIMINSYPRLLGLSISVHLQPKWDFFVLTGLPISQLVTFPKYFGYSLHKRIKPRFNIVKCSGLCWTVNRILSLSESSFQRFVEREKASYQCHGVQINVDDISGC